MAMADIFELFKKISTKDSNDAAGAPEYIIAGLGNPGAEYAVTRHNAGFIAMDCICEKLGTDCRRSRFDSLTAVAAVGGKQVLLMKPQTYMNNSGRAVRDAAAYYHIPAKNIIVISDDVNFEVGHMRIRPGGSDGGQRGLRDIIYQLEDDKFPRIRIGVGKKPEGTDMKDWVLGRITKEKFEVMRPCFKACLEASELIIQGRIDEAMGRFNGMKPAE